VLRRRLPLLALAVLATSALGCSGDDTAGAGRTTTTTTAPTTTTTAVEDTFAVPDEVDAAYVERVANELMHVLGEASRIVQREDAATDEVTGRFQETYEYAIVPSAIESFIRSAEEAYEGMHSPVGDTRITITGVRDSTPTCIVADATADFSAVQIEPVDRGPMVLTLWSKIDAQGSTHNRTPWTIRSLATAEQHREDLNGCAAQSS
jgi:hypothetical protein